MNEREYQVMYSVEDSHWWYTSLHDLIIRFVAREQAAKGQLDILDAGCGTGRLCQLLAGLGRVTGCDVSDQALSLSRTRGVDNLFKADLSRADLGVARFDLITSIDVLYHKAIEDDARVLAGFHRALKPGGLLILNLVAHEFLRSTHDIAVHTRKRYTLKELVPALQGAGFETEVASYRLCALFFPIAAVRLFKRLGHRSKQDMHVNSDVTMPNPIINEMLRSLAMAENTLLEKYRLPIGTSLFITARKP